MKLTVRVVPRSRKERVEKQPDGSYKVWVRQPPEDGRANYRLISLLSENFNAPASRIRIISGGASRIKTVEIN